MDQVNKTSPFLHPASKGKKRCSRCLEVLPLKLFPLRNIRRDGLPTGRQTHNSRCRDCLSEINLDLRFKRKYGISLTDYHRMYEDQEGKCYLCDEDGPERLENGRPRLHLDHSHTTGKARKLLCNSCNWRIGMLENTSAEWMTRALSYIDDL